MSVAPAIAAPDPLELVSALTGYAEVAVPVAELARGLGWPMEAVQGAATAAAGLGLAECWPDAPGGPSVTLSPLAAARLGLAPDDAGRWVPAGTTPRPARVNGHANGHAEPAAWLELFPDPGQPEPLETLVAAEAAEAPRAAGNGRHKGGDWRGYPAPRILLGLRIPWPVVIPEGGRCPGCGGRKLSRIAACLACDRSGVDHLLPRVERPRRPAMPDGAGLKGGRDG